MSCALTCAIDGRTTTGAKGGYCGRAGGERGNGAETAAPVKDPDLRAALEAMAQNILTRPNSKEGA